MKVEDLETIGGWRKGTEWQERWLDMCSRYFARCYANDFDEDEEILLDTKQSEALNKT